MNANTTKILELHDGKRTSKEIAKAVGVSPRYVRKVALKYDLPRLAEGGRPGRDNHQFVSGRRIDRDGYVLVTAPPGHPYARPRPNRPGGAIMYEHRLVMEKKLGRYLLPEEVVDHKDELTLHNAPSNLRLFDQNSTHLRETISGRPKQTSRSGRANIATKHLHLEDQTPVDTYGRRRARGDVRLRQCLRAALKLGIDSPFLSGTTRLFERAQIDISSHSTIALALAELDRRFAEDLAR